MSSVCLSTSVVVAAWPAFCAAVTSAAHSLGYVVMETVLQPLPTLPAQSAEADAGPDQPICLSRRGVVARFRPDGCGSATLCVSAADRTEDQLRGQGDELNRRVVQRYIRQRLVDELHERRFVVVAEEIDAHQNIRLKVRPWDG